VPGPDDTATAGSGHVYRLAHARATGALIVAQLRTLVGDARITQEQHGTAYSAHYHGKYWGKYDIRKWTNEPFDWLRSVVDTRVETDTIDLDTIVERGWTVTEKDFQYTTVHALRTSVDVYHWFRRNCARFNIGEDADNGARAFAYHLAGARRGFTETLSDGTTAKFSARKA